MAVYSDDGSVVVPISDSGIGSITGSGSELISTIGSGIGSSEGAGVGSSTTAPPPIITVRVASVALLPALSVVLYLIM
ncbi:MAG: hypothetical protein UT05_C0006G0058 [Parcubacteria group bacterium GW2011_GWF2_38_76]|nr:MAG: hypothetical protein UT05_C0006G0058 [Parcubacteria group bacterium GW2011_GWF2_38_76]